MYRLSPIQQGMLYHHIQDPRAGVDIEQLVCLVPEAVSEQKLRLASPPLVARPDVLRTSWRWESGDQPMQFVYPNVEAPFQSFDLTGLDSAVQRQRLEQFL